MALDRIEIRLSPGNAEERQLIEALEKSDEYGAKANFLKARLLRGYVAIMREVEHIRSQSDQLAALDRLAQSVNAGHYRVLRALLYQREPVSSPASMVAAVPAPSPAPATAVSAPPEQPLLPPVAAPAALLAADPMQPAEGHEAQPQPEPQPAQAAAMATPAAAPAQPEVPSDGDQDAGAAVEPVPAPKPTVTPNWSRFAGIAGKRGE
jgi:hypothetical protein